MRLQRILPAAFLAFGLLKAAHADVTYTYTGKDFDYFADAGPYYHPGDHVTATLTFTDQQDFDNDTQLFGYSQIVAASASDGHVTLTQADPNLSAWVEINAPGDVVYWGFDFDFYSQSRTQIQSGYPPYDMYREDFAIFDAVPEKSVEYIASNEEEPGTWSGPTYSTPPTPEPSSLALLGTGLAALAGLLVKRSA